MIDVALPNSRYRLIRRVDNDATACAHCKIERRPLFRYGRHHPAVTDSPFWDTDAYCNRQCRSLAQAAQL